MPRLLYERLVLYMNGWLDEKEFSDGIAALPLLSIDLLVRDESSDKYLLGWRCNRPAANHWFVPGGRVQKNEALDDAFTRLTKTELGIGINRSKAQWFGVYEHFYDDYVLARVYRLTMLCWRTKLLLVWRS